MAESKLNPDAGPNLLLRVLAAGSVVLLGLCGAIVIGGAAGLIGVAIAASLLKSRLSAPTQISFASVLFVVLPFGGFVVGAFLLRFFLNLATRSARSPLKWLGVSWTVAAPVVIFTSAIVDPGHGPALGSCLWLGFACALTGLWIVAAAGRALWTAGQRSASGATAVITAALLLVVIPGATLAALPRFRAEAKKIEATRPRVHELFAQPPTAASQPASQTSDASSLPGAEDEDEKTFEVGRQGRAALTSHGVESDATACFEMLSGPACSNVWGRTKQMLENLDRANADDALQAAYLYVCLQNSYEPEKLCGIFRDKAKWLVIDSWRYTRRFRDEPDAGEPACGLPSPNDAAMTQQERDVLDDAFKRLDERSRRILTRKYVGGLTDPAIGKELGLSRHTVRALRGDALKALKPFLQRCR
jgi:RNA polymerase sigma factor (sigma-70 family)